MELAFGKSLSESSLCESTFAAQYIQRCPFLRNINEPTRFSFSSAHLPSLVHGVKGPIFEDEPNFDMAFKLFHGQGGVVPLSGKESVHNENPEPEHVHQFNFNPLAAQADSISLSSFGFGGPFGFDFFNKKWKKQNKKSSKQDPNSQIKHLLTQMEFAFGKSLSESPLCESTFANQDIQRCPFLRHTNEPTSFSFSSVHLPSLVQGIKGPIFENGLNFDMVFKIFHGQGGVVPLSGKEYVHNENPEPEYVHQFNFDPLASQAACSSLSFFGFGGPFGFDFFNKKWKKQTKKSSNQDPKSQRGCEPAHELTSNEWLETGQCPMAKSFRAMKLVFPLVAKALEPSPGMKIRCPPAIVAVRAALARTSMAKNLRPQPLPEKMLVIALLGIAANVPLGMWREHTQKFSPQWFAAVHAAVPFIAMLRKAVLLPKTAMALTIAASMLGQTIGSRAERLRQKAVSARTSGGLALEAAIECPGPVGQCRRERFWNIFKINRVGSFSASISKTNACY